MIPFPSFLLVIEIPSTFQPSTRGWPRNYPRNYPESLFHRTRDNNRGHQRNHHRYRSFRIIGSSPPSPCESNKHVHENIEQGLGSIPPRGWNHLKWFSIDCERKKKEGGIRNSNVGWYWTWNTNLSKLNNSTSFIDQLIQISSRLWSWVKRLYSCESWK